MSLRDKLAAETVQNGPLTVAQYMTACLHDPQFGYYAARPALGEAGDFITAPLVSQMFGELIGVWAASSWMLMGEPERFRLVELGPGDGTMMEDVLRATRHAPGFLEAADIWLVETSQPLQQRQRERLGDRVRWTEDWSEIPTGTPMLMVGNEFLDCLGTRQFMRTAVGWDERVVTVGDDGELAFGLAGEPGLRGLPDAPVGAILERSEHQEGYAQAIAAAVVAHGGAALLIDYGRDAPGFGDTLQALKRHEKVDPLACPGEADLTVWADFPAVMATAEAEGAGTAILSQSAFLARMGIGERAEALVRARPDKAAMIGRQLHRLVGGDQMGELFKVCCIHSPDWVPPGFEEA